MSLHERRRGMKPNPLDPYALVADRKELFHPRDMRLGIHVTGNVHIAMAYAVARASKNGPLDGYEPNCGLILELDLSGFELLPEGDAAVLSQFYAGIVEHQLLQDRSIMTALKSGDATELALALQYARDLGDGDTDEQQDSSWWGAIWKYAGNQNPWQILSLLEDLEPLALLEVMQEMAETGTFPLEIYAAAISQWRVFERVGTERLIRVHAVHPVEPNVVSDFDDPEGEDYYENPTQLELAAMDIEPDAPLLMTEDQPIPPTAIIWQSPRAASLEAHGAVFYHGTDIKLARQALAGIAWSLRSPCQFTQPGGIGSGFVPMALAPGVGIFPIYKGKLLLGKRSNLVDSPGTWSGFGGALNPNETPEEGAMRELFEETGYAQDAELLRIQPGIYLARVKKSYKPKLNWETSEARWVTLAEARKLKPPHWGLDVVLHAAGIEQLVHDSSGSGANRRSQYSRA